MKKQSILFTFAFTFVLFINIFGLFSCSTDDFEDEEVYTLANSTRKRVGESGNNYEPDLLGAFNSANGSGHISIGNTITCNQLLVSIEKNINSTLFDYDGDTLIRIWPYDVRFKGKIYYYEDSITHNRTYAATLSWNPHDANRYRVEFINFNTSSLFFNSYIRGDYTIGLFPNALSIY